MKSEEKKFLTYDHQLELLTSQGLSIDHPEKAKEILQNIGYYELINGYKAIFKQPGSSQYQSGTSFSDLVALYKCDENLRELLFKYILRIEIHLRSVLSYAFCEKYGSSQQAYLDPHHFSEDPEVQSSLRRLLGELEFAANRSRRAPYVCYHREAYHNVPLWVLFKSVSQGTLIQFYHCADPEVRKQTASAFPDLWDDTLFAMLQVQNDFRNVCAHNECLYSFRSGDSIPPMPVLRFVHFPASFVISKDFGSDLFSMLVIFRYLLEDADFSRCIRGFDRIFSHFFDICTQISPGRLYEKMGFPPDWKALDSPSARECIFFPQT